MQTSVEINYRKDLYSQLDQYYPRPLELWGDGDVGYKVFSRDIGRGSSMAFDFWIPPLCKNKDKGRKAISSRNRLRIIEVLNNDEEAMQSFPLLRNNEGSIEAQIDGEWYSIMLIRGWSNLTAQSCHGLPEETAANIQDMFAEWIIGRLTNWGGVKLK